MHLTFYRISTVYKKRRLTPTDIHLPPKISVSHLYIFEEGVFCQKPKKNEILPFFSVLDYFVFISLIVMFPYPLKIEKED
ncbi:hypothetical protein EXW32_28950 (plasmid) [Bacillus mycoides]|nr:hypothetical protein EXW32_28950 [Bacillus mycoides]